MFYTIAKMAQHEIPSEVGFESNTGDRIMRLKVNEQRKGN